MSSANGAAKCLARFIGLWEGLDNRIQFFIAPIEVLERKRAPPEIDPLLSLVFAYNPRVVMLEARAAWIRPLPRPSLAYPRVAKLRGAYCHFSSLFS
jgi:hypothetical protein